MTRHPAHLTGGAAGQAASLEQLLDRTYFLDSEKNWAVSAQSTQYRNSRTKVETLLRQRMRGLRA